MLGRPGSDLLSRALRRSTIGAEGFHVRVRDGIGCLPLAMATRPAKHATLEHDGGVCLRLRRLVLRRFAFAAARDVAFFQAYRAIRTG